MWRGLGILLLVFGVTIPAWADQYLGDMTAGATFDCKFTTVNSSGAPTTLTGSPVASVYKNNSTTQTTTGAALTADFDGLTGLNNVRITSGADTTFYSAGSEFQVVLTAGTVGGTSVVGYVPCAFSLNNRSVQPLVANSVQLLSGTLQASTSTTAVLPASYNLGDDVLNGNIILLTGGTGAQQRSRCVDYTNSTDTCRVYPPWAVTPDTTTTFAIWPDVPSGLGRELSVVDTTPAANNFDGPAELSSADNVYNGMCLVFKEGPNAQVTRRITSYTGATRTFSFTGSGTTAMDRPFATAPANGNLFALLGAC